MRVKESRATSRHSRRRAILALLVALIAVFAISRASAELRTTQRANRVTLPAGHDLAGVTLVAEHGESFTVERGMDRPVLLLYASERCPHCHAELDRLAALMRDEPALASGVALVVVTPGSPSARVQPALHEFIPSGLQHVRVFDPRGEIAMMLRVRAVPLSLVIGRDGRIASAHVGQSDRPDLRQRLLDAVSTPIVNTEAP
jgi:peroxiredoxin